ncbi:phosphoribulokinase [Bacillus cereus]|nr:phosphoribulokinase [Bacillus cereus]MEB8796668.1 phosphoribulokinase [Bacillus cereus]MEB8992831.1 phosphoribulokinase [Bacillus cereus]MEB9183967.1 phosphoribulokinase [Bacillus cereus]
MSDEQIVIGISGHGTAGKTTFANRFANLLNQNENHRYKMTASHPAAHHLAALERDIQMVRAGLDFYTIDTHYVKSKLISSKNKVTIVEGMSAAFINLNLFDLKIYFYTDGETELMRRSSRDIAEREADINYLRQSHEERRIQYEVFMHSYSQRFDIIIKTSDETIYLEKIFEFYEV